MTEQEWLGKQLALYRTRVTVASLARSAAYWRAKIAEYESALSRGIGSAPATSCIEEVDPARRAAAIAAVRGRSRKTVCHRCDNRQCTRRDHLFLGSQSDNVLDCLFKRRRQQGFDPRARIESIMSLIGALGSFIRERAAGIPPRSIGNPPGDD